MSFAKKILPILKKMTKMQMLFAIIFACAIFLRLYNLENSVQFQGDQGRDSIIVADIFRKLDPVFIGPVTSVGNMYLGPLYYYFMLPFLILSYPSPMGPVYAVAILGILTVYFIYKFGKEMFDEKTALISAFFFTFSATVLNNTRFSWNPNPAPLASIFMIYFTYKAWKKHPKYWMLVAVCFSTLIQLHYLTLLSLGGAGIIWLINFFEVFKSQNKFLSPKMLDLLKFSLVSIFIFLASLAPLFLFDLKHDGLNRKAFIEMVAGKTNFKQGAEISSTKKILKTIRETEGRGMHILFEISIGKNRQLNQFLLYSTMAIILSNLVLVKIIKKTSQKKHGLITILAYLIVGIFGTALYEHTIFDHYIAYLFPITFLIYGYIFTLMSKNLIGKIIFIVFAIFYLQYNIQKFPLTTLGWTLNDINRTAEEIYKHIGEDEKYNIVLLSESRDHYGQNYRYFLTTKENPPIEFATIEEINTLVIINEEKATDDVVNLPIYDIVVFPNKTVSEKFSIENGPDIIVLRK